MKKVILPYIEQVKDDLDLPLKQKSLCIFDVFRAQISDEIMDFLKEKSIIPVMVPANCTDKLQPMDLSIQKPAKDVIKKKQFQEWYTNLILNQYSDSATSIKPVPLLLSVVKPLHLKWLVKLYEHFQGRPEIVTSGLREAGIFDVLKKLQF